MTRRRRLIPTGNPVRTREIILVALLFILAVFAGYISRGNSTAFGLLSKPIQKDFDAVIKTFPTETLNDVSILALNIDTQSDAVEQTQATPSDPRTPPAVTDFAAYNTRTGDGVVLEWTLPASTLTLEASVYRATGSSAPVRIAEQVKETTFTDSTVTEGVVYTYSVRLSAQDNGVSYEGDASRSITMSATDTLAPLAPTEIVITTQDAANAVAALLISWKHPEDAASVDIYRSTQRGVRGVRIATVAVTEDAEYLDATVVPNTEYWYTLVSVDSAGNTSSTDFSTPAPGNENPFDYSRMLQ